MKPYILLVVEDGGQLRQWVIRVDYLLICLAVAVFCSLSIAALPLLRRTPRQSQRWGAPKNEIKVRWAPRSGIDAGRIVLGGWLEHP